MVGVHKREGAADTSTPSNKRPRQDSSKAASQPSQVAADLDAQRAAEEAKMVKALAGMEEQVRIGRTALGVNNSGDKLRDLSEVVSPVRGSQPC